MTLSVEDREQIESELDLIRTHRANLLWNECVSVDARARRDETVGRIGPEIERLERLLNEPAHAPDCASRDRLHDPGPEGTGTFDERGWYHPECDCGSPVGEGRTGRSS